jgi:hypothetical protein
MIGDIGAGHGQAAVHKRQLLRLDCGISATIVKHS